ncbi:hypothetical protein [Streptomyces sp. NPDC008092]|uniref:hypothetical protein n=1 Tax=Streptomyces sp. NPDC008092 TaxID=3364808 RepID=UPI0036E43139
MYRLDAAYMFRTALESAPVGTVLHATGDEGVPVRPGLVADIEKDHYFTAR